MTALLYPVASASLPADYYVLIAGSPNGTEFSLDSKFYKHGTPIAACVCVWAGLWAGCLIGFVTEYYTSHSYEPVREVAQSCETGAATNIIYGLALGYKSNIIPTCLIAFSVYESFSLAGMYGVALAALGFLGTLATCLSIDVYGPVCDNAGGIAEMAELASAVRDKTDALDAAGNTTAAIGKGFAIGGAALVSLALFGGFVTRAGKLNGKVQLLEPITFAFLIMGSMLPYAFSALTMKSVGVAAKAMVKEVKRQQPGIMEWDRTKNFPADEKRGTAPDHDKCIAISTEASLREMILPGLLVVLSPIVTGIFFGVSAVSGLLAGGMASGVQLALSMSNTGGAWDNAKKYVESKQLYFDVENADGILEPVLQEKGSEAHKAAVVGDTVGDPLKDTSGPALNILMKLMAIISLVFASFFMSINNGQGLFKTTSNPTLCDFH